MPEHNPSVHAPRWVSPQITELLRKSGKRFDVVVSADMDEETYYDGL